MNKNRGNMLPSLNNNVISKDNIEKMTFHITEKPQKTKNAEKLSQTFEHMLAQIKDATTLKLTDLNSICISLNKIKNIGSKLYLAGLFGVVALAVTTAVVALIILSPVATPLLLLFTSLAILVGLIIHILSVIANERISNKLNETEGEMNLTKSFVNSIETTGINTVKALTHEELNMALDSSFELRNEFEILQKKLQTDTNYRDNYDQVMKCFRKAIDIYKKLKPKETDSNMTRQLSTQAPIMLSSSPTGVMPPQSKEDVQAVSTNLDGPSFDEKLKPIDNTDLIEKLKDSVMQLNTVLDKLSTIT